MYVLCVLSNTLSLSAESPLGLLPFGLWQCQTDINITITITINININININIIINPYLVDVGLPVEHCALAGSQIASIDDPGIAGDSDLRWKNIDQFKKYNEMKLWIKLQ